MVGPNFSKCERSLGLEAPYRVTIKPGRSHHLRTDSTCNLDVLGCRLGLPDHGHNRETIYIDSDFDYVDAKQTSTAESPEALVQLVSSLDIALGTSLLRSLPVNSWV